jgi:hypothetical protein
MEALAMTPDMQRLCDVARFAMTETEAATYGSTQQVAEAIVRAVLMALREPSDAMEEAALADTPNDFERWAPATEFTTMINAILAEPATARFTAEPSPAKRSTEPR